MEAGKIADEIRVEFPDVRVMLVEHGSTDEDDWPDTVIATPTYELNGKIMSPGNPYREDLYQLVSEAVGHSRAETA